MKPHPNCMIAQGKTDPATVRCRYCGRIAVSCDADRDRSDADCCSSCTHDPRP